jgi:hypothetical protein
LGAEHILNHLYVSLEVVSSGHSIRGSVIRHTDI